MQEVGLVDLAAARHRDDPEARVVRADLADRLDPIQLRHDDVGEDKVEIIVRQERQALASAGCGGDLVSGTREDEGQGPADRRVVVDDQDCATRCGHCGLPPTNLAPATMFPWELLEFQDKSLSFITPCDGGSLILLAKEAYMLGAVCSCGQDQRPAQASSMIGSFQ